MNELKVLNKYEQQENQFYQEGKTYDGGGYDNTCVYATLEYNGNEYDYKELDYNAGCFRDDYSIYIEDENKNLLFDYHYYMDQDRDEFHCFMNKDVITEDFYKQLQKNKLLRGDIQYNEILDFNFKKDFAKLNENEERTDLYECNSRSERNGGNKTRESEFMFKANGDVYFAKIKDTPNLDSKFLDLYKYNEKNETLENVLSYGQKHDYKEDKTVRFVMDGNSKEFNKELFVEIGMKFDINLFNENLFKNANDIEVVYDEKSNRDCDLCGIKYDGKEYSLTDFHNKEKHEIKIRSGKDEIFKYEFDEKTRESKIEIDKEKFTEEAYNAIMKNNMTKEMMPATLVYAHIRYDELDNLANQNKNTKINDFFDLKLNVDLGNYCKQISTNNKNNEQLIDIDFNNKDLKSKNYMFHKTANSNSISTNNIRIYEEKKENLVGTEINKVKYRSKYFNKKLFNIIKSDADLSSFVNEKTYSDVVKNGTDLSQDKFILSKEKEIEDNQER